MSTALNAIAPATHEPTAELPDDLASLRARLDRLDDALHDLVLQRAEVVGRIGALGVKGSVPLRPGREAAIVRRMLARHRGAFPAGSLVRLWRELIVGMTAIQRPLRIAVSDGAAQGAGGGEDQGPALFMAAAREQFGALTAMHHYQSPAQAIREVSAGRAVAAVLPVPREDESARQAWWTTLLNRDEVRVHVVGRLPFWAPRPEGAPLVQALVASTAAPDPSGADRSLLGLEMTLETSRARLGTDLVAAGFVAGQVMVRRDPGVGVARALVDVEGFVVDGDARLSRLSCVTRAPVVVGAYAVPAGSAP